MDTPALFAGLFLVQLAAMARHVKLTPRLDDASPSASPVCRPSVLDRPPKGERAARPNEARTNHLGYDSAHGGRNGPTPDGLVPEDAARREERIARQGRIDAFFRCLAAPFKFARYVSTLPPVRYVASHPIARAAARLVSVLLKCSALLVAASIWVDPFAHGADIAMGVATFGYQCANVHNEKAAALTAYARDNKPINFTVCDNLGGSKDGTKIEVSLHPDTTVGNVKARLLMVHRNEHEFTLSKAMQHCTLQKTKGAHLENDQRIGDLDIEGKTLMVGMRGLGGAPATPESKIHDLQSALYAQHEFMLKCSNMAHLKLLIGVYNVMVDELFMEYMNSGIDRNTLVEAPPGEQRLVKPCKLRVEADGSLVDASTKAKPKRRGFGGASSSSDNGPLDDGGAFGGDEMDVDGGLAADRSNGEFWAAASKDPSKDPRNRPLGPQMIEDEELEAIVRANPTLNPTGDPDFKITDANREHFQCLRPLDPSLSGHAEERQHDIVRYIYRKKIMGQKQPNVIRSNDDGSYIRVASGFLSSKPCDDWDVSVINILLGRAQSGKSYEGVADSWAKWFVHAQLPMYYCRTLGGLNDTEEMLADFHNFNDDIGTMLVELRQQCPDKYRWLTDAEIDKFKLTPRLVSIKKNSRFETMRALEVEVVDCADVSAEWGEQVAREAKKDPSAPMQKAVRFTRPQVLIGLMNPSTITKQVENGCVLQDAIGDTQNPGKLNLDGNGFLVTREELQRKLFNCETRSKRLTPFSLLCGVTHRTVSLNSHNCKQPSKTVVFHSAYAPACWDTTRPYDRGSNAKRARISRVVDEVDASTSDKKVHKTGEANYKSTQISELGNSGFDPKGHREVVTARRGWNACDAEREELETELQRLSEAKQRIENGEAEPGDDAMDVERERANLQRDARAEARARPGRAERSPSPEWAASDDEDGVEVEAHYDEDDVDEGDGVDVALDEDGCEIPPDKQEELEKITARMSEIQTKLDEKVRSLQKFDDELNAALRETTAGHVTGMQSACMYTLGISATIFGCLQAARLG